MSERETDPVRDAVGDNRVGSRAAALEVTLARNVDPGRGIALALVYVGDRIGELSDYDTAQALKRVALELSDVARAITDLADSA